MKKNRIYTRTGDTGQTSLADGTRVSKGSLRLETYGTIDELSSFLGLLCSMLTEQEDKSLITGIQQKLFVIGSQLAVPSDYKWPEGFGITSTDVEELEHAIDRTGEDLPPWRGFILPGGCQQAALCHVCRAVSRRAERKIVELCAAETVDTTITSYLNRLSDFLYIFALKINQRAGIEEILWKK